MSRRRLIGGAALLGAVGASWGATQFENSRAATGLSSDTVEFHGAHQAGIVTTPQAHGLFIAFDLTETADRGAIESILRLWTADASRLTAGRPALADTEPDLAGGPAGLTVTVGFGPRLFTIGGVESAKPTSLRALPNFKIDSLESRWSGGDLLLQICGDDLTSCTHAARVLTKNVRRLARIRWSQRGYRYARGSQPRGTTMRNIMGQLDGTANPAVDEAGDLIWDDGGEHAWFAGGTTVVIRRIRAELDTWDEIDRAGRELAIGRRIGTGAPLTGTAEHDEPDFAATVNGITVIPANAHIARAHHRNSRERFLRRAYNYDDPPIDDSVSNSGLIFTAYQRDIAEQFLPVQQRLAEADALNTWTTPVGSAVFAIPPGVAPGHYIGHTLFGDGKG